MASSKPEKKLLFSLTKKDFVVEYYNGTGDGGQNRNKVATACRIHHPASGVMSACQEERTQKVNRERAFRRLLEKPKFKKWLQIETARRMGALQNIEERVDRELKNVKTEVRDENGKFIVVDEIYFMDSEQDALKAIEKLRQRLRGRHEI
jgi:protein subunit release factor B